MEPLKKLLPLLKYIYSFLLGIQVLMDTKNSDQYNNTLYDLIIFNNIYFEKQPSSKNKFQIVSKAKWCQLHLSCKGKFIYKLGQFLNCIDRFEKQKTPP